MRSNGERTIGDYARCSAFFFDFRKRITDSFPTLFGESNGEVNEFSEEYQFTKQWGWYGSLYALSQGDITRFETVARLPIRQCLTYLAFEKQKNEIEINKLKKIKQ